MAWPTVCPIATPAAVDAMLLRNPPPGAGWATPVGLELAATELDGRAENIQSKHESHMIPKSVFQTSPMLLFGICFYLCECFHQRCKTR